MKAGITTYAGSAPNELEIRFLPNGKAELHAADGIEQVEMGGEDGTETVTAYKYQYYADTAHIDGYEEAVAGLIGLKYSIADEIALSRKDKDDEEYTAYLAYVEACKAYCKKYFGVE